MAKVKIAHEAPLALMPSVQRMTDYDYALVHLFEESQEYYDFFVAALAKGREVILDNSIFELGTAFDSFKFNYYVHKLRPTWYIIPDVLENREGTVESLHRFLNDYPTPVYSKTIGVIQGKTIADIKKCYTQVEPHVDKVAISFDYSAYNEYADGNEKNKFEIMMKGRQRLLDEMAKAEIINYDKKHHLLGCALPQEFAGYNYGQDDLDCMDFDGTYTVGHKWIDSIDTSNPVVAGLNKVMYGDYGLPDKNTKKLIDYMYNDITADQAITVGYNIQAFRRLCGYRGYL